MHSVLSQIHNRLGMINGIACTFAVTVDQPRGPNPTVRLVSGSQGSVSITSYKHGATTELRLSCGRIWSLMSYMCSIPYLIDSLTTNSLTLLLSTHVLHYTRHTPCGYPFLTSLNPKQPLSSWSHARHGTLWYSRTKRVRHPAPHAYPRSLAMSRKRG